MVGVAATVFGPGVLLERGSQLAHAERKTWRARPSNMMSRRDIARHDAQIPGALYLHDGIIPDCRDSSSDHGYNHSQNKSPHKTLRNMIPEEAFTGVKPEVGNFRIFGCPVYIHVPKEKRIKLDPSSIKGTSMGYNESSKAYQDLHPWSETD
jgi:hypothetical protein